MSPEDRKFVFVDRIVERLRRLGAKVGERSVEMQAPGIKAYGMLDALVQKGFTVSVNGHIYAPRF